VEALGFELLEQPVALEPVLDWVFDIGAVQLDPGGVQVVLEALEHVGGPGVHVGDRLGRHHGPACRRRRGGDRLAHVLAEDLGVGEEQGRVPAEQDQPGDAPGGRVAGDVVVALEAVHLSG